MTARRPAWLSHPDEALVEAFTDPAGQRWEIEERVRFGRDADENGTRIYTSTVLVVRRFGQRGGVWLRSDAAWRSKLAAIVEQATQTDAWEEE